MPVSELDIANGLFWLLGYGPSDERGRHLVDRLQLRFVRDQAALRSALLGSEEFARYAAEQGEPPLNRDLRLDRPRLVFAHIPKCGGTTMFSILARHFDPGAICPERFNGLAAYRLDALAEFTLFSGHFDLESCQALCGRNTQIVSMLREPHARLVSLYYFLKIHRPEDVPATATMVSLARSLSAEDFFRHPLIRRHASVFNGMASVFFRRGTTVRWEAVEDQLGEADLVVADPREAGARAFAALQSLAGFAMLEDMPGSLELLSATLGLRLDPMPAQQVTDEMRTRDHLDHAERPAMTPALAAILDELTAVDRFLYGEANALFAARLESLREGAAVQAAPSDNLACGPAQDIPLDRFHPLEARREGHRIVASGIPGVVAAGPYMALRKGRYRLTCHFLEDELAGGFTLNIWHNRGQGQCQSVRWTGPGPSVTEFTLAFDVTDLEFVIAVGPDSRFELLAVELAAGLEEAGSARPTA